jgi:hypothetical protein
LRPTQANGSIVRKPPEFVKENRHTPGEFSHSASVAQLKMTEKL